MTRALKITAISVAIVLVCIFAVYIKAGYFDFIWQGLF